MGKVGSPESKLGLQAALKKSVYLDTFERNLSK